MMTHQRRFMMSNRPVRIYSTSRAERPIDERRAWRLIRRHLIGEPRLMRVLELHFLGVSDPAILSAALGVSDTRALSLVRELLARLHTIRRALESAEQVRARFDAMPWKTPEPL